VPAAAGGEVVAARGGAVRDVAAMDWPRTETASRTSKSRSSSRLHAQYRNRPWLPPQ
jgi:hypothetical protein